MTKKRGGARQGPLSAHQHEYRRMVNANEAKTPLGACLWLCDMTEMEHVRELVREAFKGVRLGETESISLGLRELLLKPLDAYRLSLSPDRMEVSPAEEFAATVRRMLELLSRAQAGESDAAQAVASFEAAWCKWAAYVGSWYLWSEVPKTLNAAEFSKRMGSLGGRTSAASRKKNSKVEAILLAAVRARRDHAERDIAGLVARNLNLSAPYVRRVLRQAKEEQAAQKGKLVAGV